MPPIWLRLNYATMEAAIAVALLALGGLVLYESIALGPGWGEQGPEPGFFPFVLTLAMIVGALIVLYPALARGDRRAFFEAPQEIEDLLKVGLPIVFCVLIIRWAGLYITAGIYLAGFMAWYGGFRWYEALAGGILLPLVMWLALREGFNIAMPMSVLYTSGIVPF